MIITEFDDLHWALFGEIAFQVTIAQILQHYHDLYLREVKSLLQLINYIFTI